MKKRISGLTLAILLLFLSIGSLFGCDNENELNYRLDAVGVSVKAEYREEYESKRITADDFYWANIKNIVYKGWNDEFNVGSLVVYLQWSGAKHVQETVEHFRTLDFVSSSGVLISKLF